MDIQRPNQSPEINGPLTPEAAALRNEIDDFFTSGQGHRHAPGEGKHEEQVLLLGDSIYLQPNDRMTISHARVIRPKAHDISKYIPPAPNDIRGYRLETHFKFKTQNPDATLNEAQGTSLTIYIGADGQLWERTSNDSIIRPVKHRQRIDGLHQTTYTGHIVRSGGLVDRPLTDPEELSNIFFFLANAEAIPPEPPSFY